MARYLNPKNDLVFKKIFGEHPDLLRSFLNALLPLSPDRLIEEVTYIPTEHIPEIPGFKYTLVDVRCRDTKGRYFIVEMQLNWSRHFMQRMIFNTAATYVKQLKKGEDYDTLCPVYGLAIVDDTFTEEPHWFHHYQLINTNDTHKKLEDIQLVFLELPKFKPTTLTEKKLSILWMRYMTEINERTEQVDPLLLTEPTIKKALDYTEIAAYTPAELRTYDANWDAISTEKTIMSDKYDQGLEEGEKKGIEKGRYEIAQNLLATGLDTVFVSQTTGLTQRVVEQIKRHLNK
jgi:predicted transposase/invertase (TIGR01784 family)